MTKICPRCKNLGEFHSYKTGRRAGQLRAQCITCTREQNTNWYKNRTKILDAKTEDGVKRRAEVNKRFREAHRQELADYDKTKREKNWTAEYAYRRKRTEEHRGRLAQIKAVPCLDCQMNFPPFVMDFDHRDPLTKKFTIGEAACSGTRAWSTIEAEIAKCDIICSNCHRIRTAKSLGWYLV